MPSALPAAPFLAIFLLLLTVPHHWRMRSFATLSIIAWLAVHGVVQGVNAAIWEANEYEHGLAAKVWCDIGTKLFIGAEVGLPGCCLCLARRLYRIVSGYELSERRKRDWAVDVGLCWAMPILVMGLHIIVQGHRFDIIESVGCVTAVYFSWPSVVILNSTIFLSGLLSPVYSICTLWKLYTRHRTVRLRIQYHSDSTGNRNKRTMSYTSFVRLLLVTLLVGMLTTIFTAVAAYGGFEAGLQPWVSWSFVHDGFGFIGQFPLEDMSREEVVEIYLFWWPWPLGSVLFFVLFGSSREVREEWKARWAMVTGRNSKVRRASANIPVGDVETGSFESMEDLDEKHPEEEVEELPHSPKSVEVMVTVTVETLATRIRPLPIRPLPPVPIAVAV
ncbi:pheromone A receptor-domain-containing protein [Mycena amicta]|nr:pheromone A receptor-domain-containing protein [Mycena amicta]